MSRLPYAEYRASCRYCYNLNAIFKYRIAGYIWRADIRVWYQSRRPLSFASRDENTRFAEQYGVGNSTASNHPSLVTRQHYFDALFSYHHKRIAQRTPLQDRTVPESLPTWRLCTRDISDQDPEWKCLSCLSIIWCSSRLSYPCIAHFQPSCST